MPEIVEIRKYCDFIKKKVINKKVINVKILKGRYEKNGSFEGYKEFVKELPLKLFNVESKGKFMYFTFDDNYTLYCTLGLSGGWTFKNKNSDKYNFPDNYEYNYEDKYIDHLNIEFIFDKGSLFFFDILSYGTISISNDKKKLEKKLKEIGPDIMDKNTTLNLFKDQINKQKMKKIGIVLVNQKIISGIGNYLRADILWIAKISPHRLVKDLTDLEFNKIYKSIINLIWYDYNKEEGKKLGLISSNFKSPRDYSREFFVYSEKEDIKGNPVIKEDLYEGSQKRTIYWVPLVQH